jgi:hypothetical protein
LIHVTDLKRYWKTKLRAAGEKWYRESGNQKGSTLRTTTKQWKTLVPGIQVLNKVYHLNKQNKK